MSYDFKVLYGYVSDDPRFEQELTQHSSDGWEVMSVQMINVNQMMRQHAAYLRRRKDYPELNKQEDELKKVIFDFMSKL